MSWKPLLLVLTLLATSVLAGCVGEDPAPTTDGDDVADDPQTSGSTGSIKGQVASASLEYLADASVFLVEGADLRETDTDADGRFTFNDVAPGRVQVQVAKIGYQSGVTSIEVVAGEVQEVSFMLEPLVVKEPYTDTYTFVGFFECAYGSPVITDTCTFGWRTAYDAYKEETGEEPPIPRDPQANNKNTFYWFIGKDANAVMSEMTWGAGGGTTEKMMMYLASTPVHNDCDCSDKEYIEDSGTSPLRAINGRNLPDIYPDEVKVMDDKTLWGKVDSADNGTLEVASRAFLPWEASFAYSHAFTIHVSAFYNSYPTADYTAIPDQ